MELIVLIIIIVIGYLVWDFYRLNTGHLGAPYIAIWPEFIEKIMHYAQIKSGTKFYELGSGDGRVLIQAALRGADATGIEIDSVRVWYTRIWISLLRLSKHCRVLKDNIFDVDLSDADVVYLYLLQITNDRLRPKLERELKPGTLVISAAFYFPEWEPIAVDPDGPLNAPIWIYRR